MTLSNYTPPVKPSIFVCAHCHHGMLAYLSYEHAKKLIMEGKVTFICSKCKGSTIYTAGHFYFNTSMHWN